MTCLGFHQLLDYLDGRLDRAAAGQMSLHLSSGCTQCEGDRDWYQQVKLIASSDDSIEPPSWILKRAMRIFDTPRLGRSMAGRVGRVLASLVFDSLRQSAVAGARSSGIEGRQLLYRAEDFSIDVQVVQVDQRSGELTGQILREGESNFESVGGLRLNLTDNLIEQNRETLTALTNERGEFTITGVGFGSYDLQIDLNEVSIAIVGLPIEV